ncbi:DUF6434 domain-containing protein [Corynebacterium sp. A21]|uniref:DUF6434 domain-containing protein n=1 Tax=Corynebacterium sp. A21 TaxID=3457318 RepID=UPI003FD1BBA4
MKERPDARPALQPGISTREFQRWYWLKEELISFARELGIPTSGAKDLLTRRIAAKLAGENLPEPAVIRRSRSRQLSGELSARTEIPAGQRCSQVLRAWFTQQLGTGFHFDAPMREFFANTDGTQTLADALNHWHVTREQVPGSIDPQFEYNRFTRAWHRDHPEGTPAQLRSAWRAYRSQPIDQRGRA